MTATTTGPLRILLLDDNPHDRELTLRELRKDFPDLQSLEPIDDPQFQRALREADFQIVVTDFNLKWSSGVQIVRAVKAARPHCPVIMFTATGTQEVAVEAMKAGLDDYVIKSAKHYIRLAVAVRTCLDRTEVRLRALRSETRLQTLLDRLNLGVLRLTEDGEVLDANPAAKGLLRRFDTQGAERDNALLAAIREELPELHATHDAVERERELGLAGHGAESICVYLSLLRVRVNGHDAVDVLVEDITKMRRSAERNEELEQANRALEAFAYTVSHDLRAPLRNLQGYISAIREDCAAALSEHCRGYVGSIDEIAAMMDAMIGDVLEFSRLSRIELPDETVSVSAAVDEAVALLRKSIDEKQALVQIDIDGGVAVLGHAPTYVQVLTNLLSNALKFVPEGVAPRVRVHSECRGANRLRVCVDDAGIGIEPANHKRIFEMFQRLHGEEKYPGTGIGLALVRKSIERMGGQVGVISALGKGSRFWVELPRADAGATD